MIKTRLWRRLRKPETLGPAEAYRRWAADYGLEPNAFQELEEAALLRVLPELDGRTVLDLGCGKGRASRRVLERGARWAVAADASLAMLVGPGAERAETIHRLVCDTRALPLRPESFDVVVCALVLGHVRDLESALAAMAAVLRPGGHLLVSDFHPYGTLRGWERTFVDPAGGRTFAVEQHAHLASDYVGAFGRLGLVLEALEEPLWQGQPVVFVLRARKMDSSG